MSRSAIERLPVDPAAIQVLTLPYHRYPACSSRGEHILNLDVYLPPAPPEAQDKSTCMPISLQASGDLESSTTGAAVPGPAGVKEIPMVIYFHGGNLLFGSRTHIPSTFHLDSLAHGFAFVSVSHRLLLPCTGHDILEDTLHLLEFLFPQISAQPEGINAHIPPTSYYRLSQKTYFVSGYSAGAYLARIICLLHHTHPHPSRPRPTAAFFLSGQGGNWICPQYVFPKAMSGRLGNANDKWLYLSKELTLQQQLKRKDELEVVSDLDSDKFHPFRSEEAQKDRREVNARMGMATVFHQLGNKVDYLTGISGLSEKILNTYFIPTTGRLPELKEVIPVEAWFLFPEVVLEEVEVARTHCPVFFLHGRGDLTVRIREAENTERQLKNGGVDVRFVGVDRWGHNWMDGIWDRYANGEEGVMQFFKRAIVKAERRLAGNQS